MNTSYVHVTNFFVRKIMWKRFFRRERRERERERERKRGGGRGYVCTGEREKERKNNVF